MALFTISLNQFVEAGRSTFNGKIRIVQQQLKVNKLLTPWYQLAKNRIKLYLKNISDFTVLTNAISELKAKVPKDDKSKNNIAVSIEAIEKVIAAELQNVVIQKYDIIDSKIKNLEIGKISINVNPDLIFRYTDQGKIKLGALKFHVSKSNPFDLQQSKRIANILRVFLEEKIAAPNEFVEASSCWSYDIFAERLVHSDQNATVTVAETKDLCLELEDIYNKI